MEIRGFLLGANYEDFYIRFKMMIWKSKLAKDLEIVAAAGNADASPLLREFSCLERI